MLKNSIKRYLLIIYSALFYWSIFNDKYDMSKDTVVGHLSGLVGFVIVIITATLSRLNIIKWTVDLSGYRLILLAVVGVFSYITIIKPIDKYIQKNITIEEVESLFKQGNFTKKNTLKYLLWSIFSVPVLIIVLGVFIKLILYPIIDYIIQF